MSRVVGVVFVVVLGVLPPVAVAEPPVTTWEELVTAFGEGGTVMLGHEVDNTAGENLMVDAGRPVRLDLNGHTFTITDPSEH
jgi:hypothetical protein